MNNKTKYVFLTYTFLLLTVFLIVLLTKNFYYDIKSNSWVINNLETQIKTKNEEFDRLSKIKFDIDNWNISDVNFDKFLIKFNEDEILNYFYSYVNKKIWKLKIDSISIDKWKINDFWFNEWKIDLTATFLTEQDMINMLNSLLNNEKYNFYIHDFSYPFWWNTKNFQVNIPLKVLYK